MDSQFEALAAWVDGEPVSRTDVALALESPEGRDYVLDLMALRQIVTATTPGLAPKATAGTSRWRVFAAAAAVVLCAAGGFAAGRLLAPVPSGTSDSLEAMASPAVTPASLEAPEPTRVIRLDESTSWRENGGS